MNRLKALREGRFTQAEMAKMLGVSRSTYTKYESGAIRMNGEVLLELSRIFDVSVEAILGSVSESVSEELWDYREALRRNPERRILFSLARDASIDEVRRAVAAINALKGDGDGPA